MQACVQNADLGLLLRGKWTVFSVCSYRKYIIMLRCVLVWFLFFKKGNITPPSKNEEKQLC